MGEDQALNTDTELWREPPGDYYANSVHVTKDGALGINVGGTVIVQPLAKWHALAKQRDELSDYAFEATKAITSLTAGGSEFFKGKLCDGRYAADLPFCVQRIRERQSTVHEQLTKAVREKKALAATHEEVERLRTALRFYASPENWSDGHFVNDEPGVLTSVPSTVIADHGDRARAALQQGGGDGG